MGRVTWLLALAVTALVLAAPWPADAGTLTGSVTGLPANAAPDGVEAVNTRGVIGAAGPLSALGSYQLTVPAGTWIAVATAQSGDEPFTALGAPVRVRAHGTAQAAPAPAVQEASAAAAHRLKRGSVVTVDKTTLEDERDFTSASSFPDYTATITNDLFRACAARGITFVDSSDTFLTFARQEEGLSRSGRLAVPFAFHPLQWQYEVQPFNSESLQSSAGTIAPTEVTIHMDLDLAGTHHEVSRAFAGPNLIVDFPSVDDADVLSVVHREDAALASEMCG